MAAEQSISVPNTGAAKVRTLEITALIAGEAVVVEMQVLNIADEKGKVLDFSSLEVLGEILDELKEIKDVLAITGIKLS